MKRDTNENCPGCGRVIDDIDDVIYAQEKTWHEECAPEEPAEIPDEVLPEVPEPINGKKGKTVKQTQNDMLLELAEVVKALSAEIIQLKGRPAAATPKKKSEKGQPRATLYYVIEGFPSEKRPPQCLKVMRAIAQACPQTRKMTEVEIWDTLMEEPFPSTKAKPSLSWGNYVQTPYYIFRYYRGQMIDAGYLKGPFVV